MSDLALLRRWTDRGDAQAFREIVSRYAPMVYATCTRVLGNATEAEDVAQECFETLARPHGTPTEHLGAWLHRVATNRALDRVRSEQRRQAREASYAAERPSHVEVEWRDVYGLVDEAIAELPNELRASIVAHFLQNESPAGIARASGISRRTVSRRIARGVELIGQSLRRRGVTVSVSVLTSLMVANLAEAVVMPASLSAALGKLALAHSAHAAVSNAPAIVSIAKSAGGLLIMKKVVVGVIILVSAVAGFWSLMARKTEYPTASQSTRNVVQKDRRPAEQDSSAPEIPTAASEEGGEPQGVLLPPGATSSPGIAGRVVDGDTGEGVAGARVVAKDVAAATASTWETVSAEGGQFEIMDLESGSYLVFKEAGPGDYTGSLAEDVADVRLAYNERKEGVILLARKGGSVWGRVTDGHGGPVPDATLRVCPATNESFQGVKAEIGAHVNEAANSDAAGYYTFMGLKLSRACFIVASAPGHAPVRSDEFQLTTAANSRQIDFQLSQGSAISGWVVDGDGTAKPRTGVTLFTESTTGAITTHFLMEEARRKAEGLHSDGNGEFRIEGLPAGAYRLFAGSLRPSRVIVSERGGTPVEVDGTNDVEDVVLVADVAGQGEHFIAGRVLDANGEAVVGAMVDAVESVRSPAAYQVVTDEYGDFFADGLGAGPFVLSVTARGYAQQVLESVSVDTADLAIVLDRLGSVRGHVLAEESGAPIPGARVSVAQHSDQRDLQLPPILTENFTRLWESVAGGNRPITDGNGAFDLDDVQPGRVVLKAERSGYAPAYSEELLVHPGSLLDDVTLYLSRGAVIEGVVRTTAGAPVEGASILLIDSSSDSDIELRLLRATNEGEGGKEIATKSAAGGRFVVDGLADDIYLLRALAAGYAYSPTVTVSTLDGRSPRDVELVLDAGGTVEGYVSENGSPLSGARVEVIRTGNDTAMKIAHTDTDGHFTVPRLAPGAYSVRFVHMARKWGTIVQTFTAIVDSGQTTRQDAEYNGHAVHGTVFRLPNPEIWRVAVVQAPEGVAPENAPDPGVDWGSLVVGMEPIAPDGSYSVGDLPDGVFKLTIPMLHGADTEMPAIWETITIAGEDVAFDMYVPQ